MANIKSAKKRIKVIAKKTLRNKIVKTQAKTAIKKVLTATDKETAKLALINATKTIDKACSKGVFHKKTASRKISRLTKFVNKIA